MGAIMSLGVATANSVLVVTFARTALQEGQDPLSAAWDAGVSRLRPVLMTAPAWSSGCYPWLSRSAKAANKTRRSGAR